MAVPSHRDHAVYIAWGTHLTGPDPLPSSRPLTGPRKWTVQDFCKDRRQKTSCSDTEGRPRPWVCSTRKAYSRRLHDSSRLDTWSDAVSLSLTITASTLRLDTHSLNVETRWRWLGWLSAYTTSFQDDFFWLCTVKYQIVFCGSLFYARFGRGAMSS